METQTPGLVCSERAVEDGGDVQKTVLANQDLFLLHSIARSGSNDSSGQLPPSSGRMQVFVDRGVLYVLRNTPLDLRRLLGIRH